MILRWAKTAARIFHITRDKIRTGERWYDKHVADPLLEEVEAAKQGDLPGEYGTRTSQWLEAVSATARRKVDKQIKGSADDYIESLAEVTEMEQKRVSMASYFISNLPGGEVDGNNVIMVTEVTQEDGVHGPADPRPEKGDFDNWLHDAWPAFENSDTVDGLERRLQAIARDPHSLLNPEVFECWEDQLMREDWPDAFWTTYEDEYLQRYRRTLIRLEEASQACITFANEVDTLIETRI